MTFLGSGRWSAKRRLQTLLAATVVALLLPAAGAHAARVSAAPVIQGAGNVTTTGYNCLSLNLSNTATLQCGAAVVETGFFDDAVITMTATPRSTGGWFFSGWVGCPAVSGPSGTICTFRALGFRFPFTPPQNLSFTPRAVFLDFTGPVIEGLTNSISTTQARTVSFFWGANENVVAYTCQIDAGPFEACSSGRTYTLSEGTHTFRVRGLDNAGNTGSFASQDVRLLETVLVSGPPDFSNVRTASFRIGSVSGTAFDCRLDTPAAGTPAFTDCGSKGLDGTRTLSFTATDLAQDGVYTFQARAKDGAVLDTTPLSHAWTVDTVAPNTTVLTGPDDGDVTTLLSATFTFSSTEPLGALQCRLDTAAFANCTSPRALTNLPFGSRKFEVRAVDRAGNVDQTAASRQWTVAPADNDGDGFNQRTDCNDGDANINPSRIEILNNDVDENCDGRKEFDRDNDGSRSDVDCDDNNAARTPGKQEVLNNELDENCDGREEFDRDNDGSRSDVDCDDNDARATPGKQEILDNEVDENCDGGIGIDFDRDRDGFTRPADCNDGDSAIRPGTPDVPDNNVDENCDGSDSKTPPLPSVAATVSYSFKPPGTKATRFTLFQVKAVPAGATITVRCAKCPKKIRRVTKKSAKGGTVTLKQFHRAIKKGAVIDVRVTKAGMIGAVKLVKIRARKAPTLTTRCLPPGAGSPAICG